MLQAEKIKELLQTSSPNLEIAIKVIKTSGDLNRNAPLAEIGAKGLFTAELEEELLNNRIDLAVHSLKDLLSTLPDGLLYAGSPLREDARDALISSRWSSVNDVPKGGIIATGSTRRKAQLLELRPDLQICGLRGNIDTRLKKLNEGEWDGIIMAFAALIRIGQESVVSEALDPDQFVPAVGQGAIGLEISANREDVADLLKAIIDTKTTLCCKVERQFLAAVEGGCSTPIGCWARLEDGEFKFTAYAASIDGSKCLRINMSGELNDAVKIATKMSYEFLKQGIKDLIQV